MCARCVRCAQARTPSYDFNVPQDASLNSESVSFPLGVAPTKQFPPRRAAARLHDTWCSPTRLTVARIAERRRDLVPRDVCPFVHRPRVVRSTTSRSTHSNHEPSRSMSSVVVTPVGVADGNTTVSLLRVYPVVRGQATEVFWLWRSSLLCSLSLPGTVNRPIRQIVHDDPRRVS